MISSKVAPGGKQQIASATSPTHDCIDSSSYPLIIEIFPGIQRWNEATVQT